MGTDLGVDSDPDRADVATEMKTVIEEWFAEHQAGAVYPIDQLAYRLDLIKHWR